MFSKIIVPLDGSELSEQIVPYAATLARALLMPLELLHVVDPKTIQVREAEADGHEVFLEQAIEHQESWASTYLAALAKPIQAANQSIQTTVIVGDPAATIVQEAQPGGGRLVAMATHGRTGLARWAMGSVADTVLHQGTMPLLLFRPDPRRSRSHGTPRTIIVPLDGSEISEQALPLAAVLGRGLGAKVVVARAVSLHALAPVPAGPGVYLPTSTAGQARMYLDGHVHELCVDRVDADGVVLEGDPATEILDLAERRPDSLVVMTTHGRSGIPRMVLGSVAGDVVRRSPSPVLVVRAAHSAQST